MHSAIYEGRVVHRRFEPVTHQFEYRMFMLYLDLGELPGVFAGSRLFSSTRRALARFCRQDHLGDPGTPLDEAVRDLVAEHTGDRPDGPIRLLTHARYFGYVFNPVSFYYCFNASDTRVETIVAEVNNTPWGERHCYVLPQPADAGHQEFRSHRPAKRMHVSPFIPMDIDYEWRFRDPGEHLNVFMAIARQGRRVFDAALELQRRELTPRALRQVLLAFPLMTLKVIVAIHWQALRLWFKGCPVYEHPANAQRIK